MNKRAVVVVAGSVCNLFYLNQFDFITLLELAVSNPCVMLVMNKKNIDLY